MKFKLLLLSLVLSTAVIGQDTLTSEDVIVEVTNEIANDLSPVLDLIKKGEKPNDTAGWIMLIFTTLLPFIESAPLVSTTEVLYLFSASLLCKFFFELQLIKTNKTNRILLICYLNYI